MRISTPRFATSQLRRALRTSAVALVACVTLLVGASSASAGTITGVSFDADTYVSDTPSAVWTIGFTTSATGALATGNAVMVTYPAGFDVSGASAALVSGFGLTCATPNTVVSGQNIFVELTGVSCALGASTPAVLTITGVSSPLNQYGRGVFGGFRVASYATVGLGSPIDGVGGYPTGGPIDMVATLTYSTDASDGTPTSSGTPPVDGGSPFTIAANSTTAAANSDLTLAGYAFAGWCTTNAAPDPTQCTGTQYAPTDPITVGANTTLYSVWTVVTAADGSGTLTTPTSSVDAGSTNNTLVFTYTAATGGMANGAVHVQVPAGWSAPSAAAGAGCTRASAGTLGFAGQTIQVTGLTLAGGATFTITYGATSGGSCTAGSTAVAPGTAGTSTFTATQKSLVGGALTPLAASPAVTVAPLACAAGRYLSGATCVPADPGSYVPTSGATNQTPCPVGTFSTLSGAIACTPAQLGRYVNTTGAVTSTPCPVGTFSSTTGATSCTVAPPGRIVSMQEAIAAYPCSVGSFAPDYGSTRCTYAPPGSFVAAAGSAKAEPCAVNTFASTTGSTSCNPCKNDWSTRGATGASKCQPPALRAGDMTFSWGDAPNRAAGTIPVLLERVGNWGDSTSELDRYTLFQERVPVPNGASNCSAADWSAAVRTDTRLGAGEHIIPRSVNLVADQINSPWCIRYELTMYSTYANDEPVVVRTNVQNTGDLPRAAVVMKAAVKLVTTFTVTNNDAFKQSLIKDLADALKISSSRLTIMSLTPGVLMRSMATPPATMFRVRGARTRSGTFIVRIQVTKAGRAYLKAHPTLKGTRQRVSGTFFVRLKGSPTPVRLRQTFWMRMPR